MEDRTRYLIQGIIGVIAVFGLTFGRTISYPDNLQKLHGLPLVWGEHQLVTIIGPVDLWSVNVSFLMIDVIFWVLVVILAPMVYARFHIVTCDVCERSELTDLRTKIDE